MVAVRKDDLKAIELLDEGARSSGIKLDSPKINRSSSRLCLSVEHGDYNGTLLFGLGTDRFIWIQYTPTVDGSVELYSANEAFSRDGIVRFMIGTTRMDDAQEARKTWARFPRGIDYVCAQEKITLKKGIRGIVYGNIPGGGLSRSASLCLNLLDILLRINRYESVFTNSERVINMAVRAENEFVGSPCGKLDQAMIWHAKEGMGTKYNPRTGEVEHIPFGGDLNSLVSFLMLDTGTERTGGLGASTYRVRRAECEQLVALLNKNGYPALKYLAEITDRNDYDRIMQMTFDGWDGNLSVIQNRAYLNGAPVYSNPTSLKNRFKYVHEAQERFAKLIDAWRQGQVVEIGRIFREDGFGLRDPYNISGPELETMCNAARNCNIGLQDPLVLGERMVGGGDKGASCALVRTDSVGYAKQRILAEYVLSHPDFAKKALAHSLQMAPGIVELQISQR